MSRSLRIEYPGASSSGRKYFHQVQAVDASGDNSSKTAYVNVVLVAGLEWVP